MIDRPVQLLDPGEIAQILQSLLHYNPLPESIRTQLIQ
jgi:hypothetical protein